ncbi:hypothetical protein PTTG_28784 [Puccinia triticina 1-1 BBBD Race 1]|uniref:Uncharacterized protein n=1 Tax=Puccinia triticina (isolate 1-1 / race 1 (BBBD)) TaxID=630390 RepID=A0A180G980_PUCT1|nr:hypothetical protein PTTG_28784 [Puccinia triticina 1-1 BBBD Race 1]
MNQATKAVYLNARDYNKTKLSMKYLNHVISSFKIITNFLPWKIAISQYHYHMDEFAMLYIDQYSVY